MNSTHSQLSARLTVLALRSSLPDSPSAAGSKWVIMPHGTALTSEEFVAFLAESTTPLRCEAHWGQGHAWVEVTLSSSPTAGVVDRLTDARDSARRIDDVIRSELALGATNPLVLVRGSSESILVTLEDLGAWLRSFSIRRISLGVEDPDQEAAASGARAVVILGSSSGARIEFLGREATDTEGP